MFYWDSKYLQFHIISYNRNSTGSSNLLKLIKTKYLFIENKIKKKSPQFYHCHSQLLQDHLRMTDTRWEELDCLGNQYQTGKHHAAVLLDGHLFNKQWLLLRHLIYNLCMLYHLGQIEINLKQS